MDVISLQQQVCETQGHFLCAGGSEVILPKPRPGAMSPGETILHVWVVAHTLRLYDLNPVSIYWHREIQQSQTKATKLSSYRSIITQNIILLLTRDTAQRQRLQRMYVLLSIDMFSVTSSHYVLVLMEQFLFKANFLEIILLAILTLTLCNFSNQRCLLCLCSLSLVEEVRNL